MISLDTRGLLYFLVIWSPILLKQVFSLCYFADYLQGEYLTQTTVVSNHVQYTGVSITAESISTWGYCAQKLSHDLYLIENYNNSAYCIRCFHISIKSSNVIAVRMADNSGRCWLSMAAAENSCPKADNSENGKQMILYKTSKDMKKVNCPINGSFMVQYRQFKANSHPIECSSRSLELSNCPVGSELNIHFQDCPFENYNLTFECMGSWDGPSNQRFLAVHDIRSGMGDEVRPRYRCALYHEDSTSRTVYLAFSSDSTCISDLRSSQSGFETYKLTPYPNTLSHVPECRFPDWAEGEWHSATVTSQVFTYTDQILFTTYSFHCLHEIINPRNEFPNVSNDEKTMLVYGRTTCGQDVYTCIWAKRRGINVFEFQLGRHLSADYNASLCSFSTFQQDRWITQARRKHLSNSPCPIEGEHVGTIPNTENLCAKLSSDCSSTDTMYYTVSDCAQQIYEDRRRRYKRTAKRNLLDGTPMPTSSSHSIASLKSANTFDSRKTLFQQPATISIDEALRIGHHLHSASTQLNDVQNYHIENKKLSTLPNDDGEYDVSALTFLPQLFSSSTVTGVIFDITSPAPPYNSSSVTIRYLPQHHNRHWFAHQTPYHQEENYQSREQLKETYYQDTIRSEDIERREKIGNLSYADPNSSNRRTSFYLPPVQLRPVFPTNVFPTHSKTRANVHDKVSFRIFRDREYKCLGQWQENDLTYTFTERKNLGIYECFVGVPISETEFSIREAGRNCDRTYNSPQTLPMILTKKSSCVRNRNSSTNTFLTYPPPPIVAPVSAIPVITTLLPPDITTTAITATTNRYIPGRLPKVPQNFTNKLWKSHTNSTTDAPQLPLYGETGNPLNSVRKIFPSSFIYLEVILVVLYILRNYL